MFSVSVSRSLSARHFFEGAHGKEGMVHSHLYKIEITISGVALDENGFLLDIEDMEHRWDNIVQQLSGTLLNDLGPMHDHPSVENLCVYISTIFTEGMHDTRLRSISVRTWESEEASATYERDLR